MSGYERWHRNPTNLLIHATTVPLFVLALVAAALCPFLPRWEVWWGASVCLAVYSVLLQRFGHRLEAERQPRRGAAGAVGGFLAEQFVSFPRFVLDGGWSRNWRRAQGPGSGGGR